MKKESFSVTILATDADRTHLLLEGQLVIRNAGAIKKELLSALNCSNMLELDLKNIIKLDLSVLQLLIGLQKSAALPEKQVSYNIELTEPVTSILHNSGLEQFLIKNMKSHTNAIH